MRPARLAWALLRDYKAEIRVEMTMTNELAGKVCTPCRGGIPPMTVDEAKQYLEQTPGWGLDPAGTRIERAFQFANFKEALDFVDQIGALAEAEGHHPDIRFGWGYCTVELYTHKIKGLHENDFIMAAKIDELARANRRTAAH
jgi:4a-hydroxytetrahydrobiopterin dehydratase